MNIVDKRKHKLNKTYICMDCVFVFTVHSKFIKNCRPYCPSCGDSITVSKYNPPTKKQEKQRDWQPNELELIDKIIKGELKVYQVASKTGRSSRGVYNRMKRRKKELLKNEN